LWIGNAQIKTFKTHFQAKLTSSHRRQMAQFRVLDGLGIRVLQFSWRYFHRILPLLRQTHAAAFIAA
jgi:hypothetical protein